jgi:hypothetical protein
MSDRLKETAMTTETRTPAIDAPYDIPRINPDIDDLLAEWRQTIQSLSEALAAVGSAKDRIVSLTRAQDLEEAERMLIIDGKNAEQRNANLKMRLAASPSYEANLTALKTARLDLADAERRVNVAREHCRLFQAYAGIYGGLER